MTGAWSGGRWPSLLLFGAAAGVYVGGLSEAIGCLLFAEPWSWGEMAVRVVVWTLLGPPLWAVIARAAARGRLPMSPSGRVRARRSQLIAGAMRTGVLPPDVDLADWRPALDGEVREMHSLRWLTVVFAAIACGSIGAAAAVANDNDWRVWAVALVVAAEAWVVLRVTARRLGTARSLLAQASAR